MRTKINYQKADGKWYELICYDYSIEQDDEKLTSDNSDYTKCEHERGSMVTENGQEWFVCKHCNKKYERYF